MGDMRNACNILTVKPEGKTLTGRLAYESILLKSTLGYGLVSSGSGYLTVVGCCEHSYEPSGCIKDGGGGEIFVTI
jgi:hypothetical protein